MYKFDDEMGGTLGVAVEKIAWGSAEDGTERHFSGHKVWSLTSSSHHDWRSAFVPLYPNGASTYRLVFIGEGRGGDGFIRVDNVLLSSGSCQPKDCSSDEFQCVSSLTCIPTGAKCNSINDCSDVDLSDEINPDCASSLDCVFDDPFLCGYRNVSQSKGVWISHKEDTTYEKTPIRISGRTGSYTASGRVQVYHNGLWGDVCAPRLGLSEFRVLCTMLGYAKYASFSYTYWSGRRWLANLDCVGFERDLSECSHDPWGIADCGSYSSLKITCEKPFQKRHGLNTISEGVRAMFSRSERFADAAVMVTPECTEWESGCADACLSVSLEQLSDLHTPLSIFAENNNGRLTALWSSYRGGDLEIMVSPDTRRLQFFSRFSYATYQQTTINSVQFLDNCTHLDGNSSRNFRCNNGQWVDLIYLCNGFADCADNSDEWNNQCENTSLSCSFEGGHSCGFSSLSGSNRWRVARIKDAYRQLLTTLGYWYLSDDRHGKNGHILYYDPFDCQTSGKSIQELVFPQDPRLTNGACITFYFWGKGNLTLSTPNGNLFYYSSEKYNYRWNHVEVQFPPDRPSLSISLLSDCSTGFFAIDDLNVSPGLCTNPSTTRQCYFGKGFICDDGNYLQCGQVCNGRMDCNDGSDEQNCHCTYRFSCGDPNANGSCVDSSQWCDGVADCPAATDEVPGCSCPRGTFSCHSEEKCLHIESYCNYHKDCIGGEDEPVDCSTSCHPDYQFKCGNGFCVSSLKRCDSVDDCGDLSDEMDCQDHEILLLQIQHGRERPAVRTITIVATQASVSSVLTYATEWGECPGGIDEGPQCLQCGKDQFQCATSGLCVNQTVVCNGIYDCNGGSDEINCTECDGFVCEKSGQCLPGRARCNRYLDCIRWRKDDLSDELSCNITDGFRCNNGIYIWNRQLCDGVDHCGDFSDERQCNCTVYEFTCDSGQCVRSEFYCDGHQDCDDGSDEWKCRACGAGQVLSCRNQVCLDEDQICDGQFHCEDGSDELNCGSFHSGTETNGTVYFNKSGSSYPLCAENIVSDERSLQLLCDYLTHG
ncbi:low-density lipoprotein receptor-related protein 2-like [Liolophura sinensis]|uniref:low-density lipoprotein receptor-related protein 2-like n=1 Tax=Liolophura sinensis TaxID=3198878 RepID=UPI0031590880